MDGNIILEHKGQENEDRNKGMITSFVVHLILLLLCLIPGLSYLDPPEQIAGIYVQLGEVEEGGKETVTLEEKPEEVKNTNTTKKEEEKKTEEKPVPVEKKEEAKDLQEESPVVQEEVKKKKKEELAEERKREEERKAAALEAEKEKKKKAFGDLFKSNGKGNNDSSGNEGKSSGDPDASVLDKLSTGSGRVGKGLSNRKVVYEPKIRDNSQKYGAVAVEVCVDKSGKVIKAKYTQKGSTTTDRHLIKVAEDGVRKYRFNKSELDEQCGTITIRFDLE